MSKKPASPTVVGAFVICGLVLIAVAIGIWGSGTLFQKKFIFVCYFKGSVNGLTVGAPVKYRGVDVGQVIDVRIRYAQKPEDTRIPVFVEIFSHRARELGAEASEFNKVLVARGLRAQLGSQSLLTGQLYVYLDYFPETPVMLSEVGDDYPELPTVTTPLDEARDALAALVTQFKNADLAHSIGDTLETIRRLVGNPGLAQALNELPATVTALRSAVDSLHALMANPSLQKALGELPATVKSVHDAVADIDGKLTPVAADLSTTAKTATATLTALRGTVAPDGRLVADFDRAVIKIDRAATAVQTLAESLERNPSSLIFGRKR